MLCWLMACGIYLIVNCINDKIYVGRAIKIKVRWKNHKCMLQENRHYNVHLQHAWNKDGAENFGFSILEECNIDKLIEREQFWIDYTQCYKAEKGYNLSPSAGSNLGFKHTKETIEKLKNRKHTEEAKAKIAEASRNRVHTRESIEKGAALRRGQKRSEEARARMSEGQKGRKHPEHILIKMRGRKMSDSHKTKIKEILKGNQFNRNRDKWSCKDGWKCKCLECKKKRNDAWKQRQLAA